MELAIQGGGRQFDPLRTGLRNCQNANCQLALVSNEHTYKILQPALKCTLGAKGICFLLFRGLYLEFSLEREWAKTVSSRNGQRKGKQLTAY